MMKRVCVAGLAVVMMLGSSPAVAASKIEKECGYQADIVTAIQKARLDNVRERKVMEVVMAGEVSWPERYNDTIPLFAAEVYKHKKRDLRNTDQGAEWRKLCLENYK